MNEYGRIQGIISGYADRFAGKHNIQQLKNRQSNLRRLFKESHEHNHPIQGKPPDRKTSVSSKTSLSRYLIIHINISIKRYETGYNRIKKERNI